MKAKKLLLISVMIISATGLFAQSEKIAYYRPYDQRGINTFESPAKDTVSFKGLQVRIGGNFTQQFQSLSHSNTALPNNVTIGTATHNLNSLYPLAPGFNLATANLRFDIQLEDGIRVSLENYMSSRHHPEFWVKGGYIQVDKLPMFGNPDWFTRYFSVKIGHFGINYGDQHFRRSDNGNTILNPFVGNYIMDAFATEIGGELYIFPHEDMFLMAGMTGGLINGDVKTAYDSNGEVIRKNPSILAKAGYDSQLTDDLRVRFTASIYANPGTTRNTLYAGDRTGSRYYMAVEPERYVSGGAFALYTPTNRFTSGRINPGLTHKVTSVSVNPFVKFRGLEFFGTWEMTNGTENPLVTESRSFTQIAGEMVYRFLPGEQAFIAGRYNKVTGLLAGYSDDISVDRIQVSAGWYTTKNLLLKLEYVNQNFNGFSATDYRNGAKFNGFVIEAAIGF